MGEVVYAPQFGGRPARAEHVSTRARVLIVDGDPAALAAIAQVLQSEGHATATAFDASGAVAVAERLGPFDLLILDIASTAGLDLVDTLRRRDPVMHVLYVTDRRDLSFTPPVPTFGDDDVLEKPFSESDLVDAVSALLDWRAPRNPR
jgi:DNA-binding response OmpR family regulator